MKLKEKLNKKVKKIYISDTGGFELKSKKESTLTFNHQTKTNSSYILENILCIYNVILWVKF